MTLEQLIEMGLEEEVAQKVLKAYQESIKDKYIPIARFNEVNEEKKELKTQLEERDEQLKELKEKAQDSEELSEKIAELEEQNKQAKEEYETKMAELKKNTAIDIKLKDARAKNIKAVKALLDLEKISLDGENLIGIDEQLETLKEKESYLFGEDKLIGGEPNKGGTPTPEVNKNPFSKEHFNLTEQGRLFREDPELAKKLKELAK